MANLPEPEDDSLPIASVGIWGESKYRFIALYCDMFTKSMRRKWDQLVYVDLFSGSGLAQFRDTSRIVYGSPFIALGLDVPFDRYILCESGRDKIEALEERVNRWCPDVDVRYLSGDVNESAVTIIEHMPPFSRRSTVLGLCLSDPFKMSNLHFSTIRTLSDRYLDFLVLIPTYMDANRNLATYVREGNPRIENFTGVRDWRQRWLARGSETSFDVFLTDCYGASMEELNYRYQGIERTVLIKSVPKNLPLYRLALFSRHELGQKFWNETRKYGIDQIDLFDQ